MPTIEHRDLPQLHANSAVQLDQTCLEVHGLALGVVQVDGGALVVMTLNLPQVHSQVVTQLTELCFTGVLQAKLKCYGRNGFYKLVYKQKVNFRYYIICYYVKFIICIYYARVKKIEINMFIFFGRYFYSAIMH